MSDSVQRDLFPAHSGQPGAAAAWRDEAINQRFHGFYADLLPNMQQAYTRPRYPAFHALELANGRILQEFWDDSADLNTTLDRLRAV
jgi:multiple sugar transport system substrate-binding protein